MSYYVTKIKVHYVKCLPENNECLLLAVVVINVARKSSDDFGPLLILFNLYLPSAMFTKSHIRHMVLNTSSLLNKLLLLMAIIMHIDDNVGSQLL